MGNCQGGTWGGELRFTKLGCMMGEDVLSSVAPSKSPANSKFLIAALGGWTWF